MKKQVYIALIIIALSSLACSISLPFNLTGGDIGESQTLEVAETVDTAAEVNLFIEMGGGNLNIVGGAQRLVEGTIQYNVDEWKPEIIRDASSLTIQQDITTIPIQPNFSIQNDWNLRLGSQPMRLSINAGAYEGRLDFSDVPITQLEIRDGASNARILFSSPNPVRMQSFIYRTGASDIEITGLANANVAEFSFSGGAGKAVLDFSGILKENMKVEIDGGVGDIRIIVPQGTHCILHSLGELVDINNNGWEENDGIYTIPGEGALIEIELNLSVGSLELDME